MYVCAYNMTMDCDWDRGKAQTNLRKHGLEFADTVAVLEDDAALTLGETSTKVTYEKGT